MNTKSLKVLDERLKARMLRKHDVACFLTDNRFNIVASVITVHGWFGADDYPKVGRHLFDVFPELAGAEERLHQLVHKIERHWVIPAIQRKSAEGMLGYFDLSINATHEEPASLIVIFSDVTAQAILNQQLMQQRNEVRLLHGQLREADDRLAFLLKRFVPSESAQQFIRDQRLPYLGGQHRVATILFADVRDFSFLVETYSPEQVLDILDVYLSVISDAVWRHQGTIIQYVGSMVMAGFNVPENQPDHAQQAAQAALDVRNSLEGLTKKRRAEEQPVLACGLGLSTGMVIAGYMGTENHYEYSAIGDTTHVAYHLCARAVAGQIIVSRTTVEILNGLAECNPLGAIAVGQREPLQIYELTRLK